jgi:uncharacterized protein (TIGR02284 family)
MTLAPPLHHIGDMQPTIHPPIDSDARNVAIEVLNDLIQLDHDAVQAYKQAIEKIDDPAARMDVVAFRGDHERHIADLTQTVRMMGGEPEKAGRDLKGVLLEGLTALRAVTGTLGALRAMRMNEKLTNRAYERALEAKLPSTARDVVLRNREDERRHLAAIEGHIERLGNARPS